MPKICDESNWKALQVISWLIYILSIMIYNIICKNVLTKGALIKHLSSCLLTKINKNKLNNEQTNYLINLSNKSLWLLSRSRHRNTLLNYRSISHANFNWVFEFIISHKTLIYFRINNLLSSYQIEFFLQKPFSDQLLSCF